MPVLSPRKSKPTRQPLLLDATIRDFSGGWNAVDSDLNLDTKFSKILENIQRGIDGANSVRPGTVLFAETSAFLDEIINCEYFSGHIIAVGRNGKMVKVDATGNVYEIWSDDWADNLKGSPSGWDGTNFASFAVFNGSLIVANGVNKPVIITPAIEATYLKDLADDSNANTPIARFVFTRGRYLLMAGNTTSGLEDRLHISATDTSGTWVGDSAPNDAVNIDLGSRVPSGSSAIKGLGGFRDLLMVMFEDAVLPTTLGKFVDDVHVPIFADAFDEIGSLSHRVIQPLGADMIFADVNGVSVIERALFTGSTVNAKASELIDPPIQSAISIVNSTVALEDKTWSLWDSQNNNYMMFIPDAPGDTEITEYRCFVYKKNKALKIKAWQDWRNWKFRSGCRSALKSIFMTEGTQIFRLGHSTNKALEVLKDYEGDQEMWDDNTPWSDFTGWNPVADVKDSGIPIKFTWELPWSDNKKRFDTKNSRFINFDTEGDNKFLVEMFTDNIYIDKQDFGEDWQEDTLKWDDDLGWDVDVLNPTLSMEFEGGDGPGFGADEFGEDFGGGRPTRLEKLYAWTTKYKLAKLRMSGEATKKLKFVSITLGYLLGSPRR
jgi:hypothetical protein